MKGLFRLCLATALILSAGGKAGAEHVEFDYTWRAGALQAGAPGGVRLSTAPVPAMLLSGSANLGAAPGPLGAIAPLVVETPPGAAPLSLDAPFSLAYAFYEGDRRGHLTVTGQVQGTLGPSSSTMTLTFAGPGSVRLGDHLYKVWIDTIAVPPAPGRSGVVLRPRLAVSEAVPVPEPSALALAGAAGLTLAAFRQAARRTSSRGAASRRPARPHEARTTARASAPVAN